MSIFEVNLLLVHVFVKILVYNLSIKKFGMYKQLCRDVLKLSSRFLGTECAGMLKQRFKDAKLKITTGSHIMSPEQWIASVVRMEKIRESKI